VNCRSCGGEPAAPAPPVSGVRHVIAVVDGSEASLAAASYGGRLVESARGQLTIAVHVRSHWAAAVDLSSALPVPVDEVELELLCRLSRLLDESVLWQLRTLSGDPATAIAALAGHLSECVVVVGVGRGAGGWRRTGRLIRTLSGRYGLPVVVIGREHGRGCRGRA
jgi:Universal stress protein family